MTGKTAGRKETWFAEVFRGRCVMYSFSFHGEPSARCCESAAGGGTVTGEVRPPPATAEARPCGMWRCWLPGSTARGCPGTCAHTEAEALQTVPGACGCFLASSGISTTEACQPLSCRHNSRVLPAGKGRLCPGHV